MDDEESEGHDEDPNFVDSDNDVASDKDDILYDRNVTDGIVATCGSHDIILPSWTVPQKGKRQTNRRRGVDEDVVMHSQGKCYVRKKGRVKMTCSTCGARGHNKRYHDRPVTPNVDDWFEAELEPMAKYGNVVGNEQENMVVKRVPHRKGSSSTHNPGEGQKFQFMPTPMAVRKMQTGSLTSGLAATLPSVNVPTTEVNFEVIVDGLQSIDAAESSRLRVARARKRRNAKISMATS